MPKNTSYKYFVNTYNISTAVDFSTLTADTSCDESGTLIYEVNCGVGKYKIALKIVDNSNNVIYANIVDTVLVVPVLTTEGNIALPGPGFAFTLLNNISVDFFDISFDTETNSVSFNYTIKYGDGNIITTLPEDIETKKAWKICTADQNEVVVSKDFDETEPTVSGLIAGNYFIIVQLRIFTT
ncbi:MAG: hypothetical protein GX220_09365 [Treponema sp.]|nr:hypothetical protein [Treponema sp.]